jgi:hypothetical protein
MLTLSKTTDCSYIEIKSDNLSDFISSISGGGGPTPVFPKYPTDSLATDTKTRFPSDSAIIDGPRPKPIVKSYTSFSISAKVNCCTETTYGQTLTSEDWETIQWSVKIPNGVSGTIDGIFFENIYTGATFNVLPGPVDLSLYQCDTGDILNLFPIIDAYFLANFGISITQSFSYDSITNECTYIIAGGLPISIKPSRFEFTLSSVPVTNYFTFLPLNNAFFDGDTLLLTPAFFNMLNFQDGIYTIELTYINSEGSVITEKNCFFLDCNTACTVSTKIKELQEASNEKNATNIFLLHYTLTEGSNCGCNCDELCEIFTKLCNNLNSSSCLCGCV